MQIVRTVKHFYINRCIYIRIVSRTIYAEICFARNEDQRLLGLNILHVQKGHIALLAVQLLNVINN